MLLLLFLVSNGRIITALAVGAWEQIQLLLLPLQMMFPDVFQQLNWHLTKFDNNIVKIRWLPEKAFYVEKNSLHLPHLIWFLIEGFEIENLKLSIFPMFAANELLSCEISKKSNLLQFAICINLLKNVLSFKLLNDYRFLAVGAILTEY